MPYINSRIHLSTTTSLIVAAHIHAHTHGYTFILIIRGLLRLFHELCVYVYMCAGIKDHHLLYTAVCVRVCDIHIYIYIYIYIHYIYLIGDWSYGCAGHYGTCQMKKEQGKNRVIIVLVHVHVSGKGVLEGFKIILEKL